MVSTGEIFTLINIKMKKYIILSILILAILLIIQFPQIFTIQPRGGLKLGYVIFLVALIALSMLPKINVVKTSLSFKGVQLYHNGHKNKSHIKESHHNSNNNNLIVTSENFHQQIETILDEIDYFTGQEIYAEGVVHIDENYDNKFIITEIDMNCCIVDASYLGILCEFNNKDITVSPGDNIKVKGKLNKYKIKDKNDKEIWVPLIYVYDLQPNIDK